MATIVNARDVLLQATTPRLLPVLLPGNITVESARVVGLPDFYESARQVEISSTSQIFQIPKVGSITPANIVITANLRNIIGTVTWTVLSGTVSYTTGTNTLTITNSGLTSDTVTLRASVTSDSVTYTDQITIVKVAEGIDAITGFLTNESTMVSALADGTVLGYGGTDGTFKVFQGIVDKTGTAVAYSIAATTAVSISIATTGAYTLTSLTADTGSATMRATYGGVTVDKIYTVTKSKAGSNGAAGARGTVNIARAIAGSVWADSEAASALSTNGYSAAQSRDIVTLYNTSTNFSQSKFYDGTAWMSLDAYVNGNMLVTGTVSADKLIANTITAASGVIADAAITTAKIASLAVGTAQIADANITTAKIASLAVGSAQIADAAITNAKIGSAAIATANIIDANITTLKIGANQVTFPNSAVTEGDITCTSLVWTTLQSVVAPALTGAPVHLIASAFPRGSSSHGSVQMRILRNGVQVGLSYLGSFSGYATPFTVQALDQNPPTGSTTYTLELSYNKGGASIDLIASSRAILMLEVKR